ncbi:MAG: hypothetical protein QM662_02710 [Gordonia sp. (in: high G+C Gram-positive bacteria)]
MTATNGAAATIPSTEVCYALWAFAHENTGLVLRVSGRAYVLTGTDAERSSALRYLSRSDFYAAAWKGVPERYVVVEPSGRRIRGAVYPSQLDDHGIFAEVLADLEVLPVQVRSRNGGYEEFQLSASNPQWMITVVVESNDGRLIPQIRQ